MDFVEIAKAITNYGLLVIISSLAIWFVVYNYMQQGKRDEKLKLEQIERDNKYNESLQMLAKSIDNQTKLLELYKTSLENTEILLKQHDERVMSALSRHDDRAITIKEEIIELKGKRSKKS